MPTNCWRNSRNTIDSLKSFSAWLKILARLCYSTISWRKTRLLLQVWLPLMQQNSFWRMFRAMMILKKQADEGSRCDDWEWAFLQQWWKCSYWSHCHGLLLQTRHIYTWECSMRPLKAPSLKKRVQVFCREKHIHYAPKHSSATCQKDNTITQDEP